MDRYKLCYEGVGDHCMKVLLFGARGRVGWELQRSLAPLGELIALDYRRPNPWNADLRQLDQVAKTVSAIRPDVIVDAAAYTDVDKAESDADAAYAVNAAGPEVLAREARKLDAWLIHFSTDYVYDGRSEGPIPESTPPKPLNVYGKSKLQGEDNVRASGCRHLILRTGWVHCPRRSNFGLTMLELAVTRDRLTVVSDQFGAPTGADLIADVVSHTLPTLRTRGESVAGTYHVVASGKTNWHEYAQFVIEWGRANGLPIRVGPDDVVPITSAELARPARRPCHAHLSTDKLSQTFGLVMPDWRCGVERMLDLALSPSKIPGERIPAPSAESSAAKSARASHTSGSSVTAMSQRWLAVDGASRR
jgi:dTDP-4-dehydrorhamnose reductase